MKKQTLTKMGILTIGVLVLAGLFHKSHAVLPAASQAKSSEVQLVENSKKKLSPAETQLEEFKQASKSFSFEKFEKTQHTSEVRERYAEFKQAQIKVQKAVSALDRLNTALEKKSISDKEYSSTYDAVAEKMVEAYDSYLEKNQNLQQALMTEIDQTIAQVK